jgi:isopenicillin-N epimerase
MIAETLRDYFLLDPNIHFLNHGSFGACPIPVFEQYQQWQRELERKPIEFLARRAASLLRESRESLARYLNCPAEDVVYFPNPTTAINMVARSLALSEGDEILASNHEYGAMDRTWRFAAAKTGVKYINYPIPLPVSTHAEFIDQFWQGVTPNTKVIFLSHITSETALIIPVEKICARAKAAGILTVIDGAHAPGQIPVDLEKINADIYTGACHKWLGAPKGSAFLYANKASQPWLEPLVVSWGFEAEKPGGSQFIDYHEWQGTNDISSYLSVPAAIEFQEEHDWRSVRKQCREMLGEARKRLVEVIGIPEICPDRLEWWAQMAAIELPELDLELLQRKLYAEYQVEVPVYRWAGVPYLRVSIQGYNTQVDIEALINGLKQLILETHYY